MNIEELKKLKENLVEERKEYAGFNGQGIMFDHLKISDIKKLINNDRTINLIEEGIVEKLKCQINIDIDVDKICIQGYLFLFLPSEDFKKVGEKIYRLIEYNNIVDNCVELDFGLDPITLMVGKKIEKCNSLYFNYDFVINKLKSDGFIVNAPDTFNELKEKIINGKLTKMEIIADFTKKKEETEEPKVKNLK